MNDQKYLLVVWNPERSFRGMKTAEQIVNIVEQLWGCTNSDVWINGQYVSLFYRNGQDNITHVSDADLASQAEYAIGQRAETNAAYAVEQMKPKV